VGVAEVLFFTVGTDDDGATETGCWFAGVRVPWLKVGVLLPFILEGLDERFGPALPLITVGFGVNVGPVLPTGTRLLGRFVDGPVLFSPVGGLVDIDGTKLPTPLVGPALLNDGDDEGRIDAPGALVDGTMDTLC